jgi:hypothetical protein
MIGVLFFFYIDYSLFDTGNVTHSFLGSENNFVPYLALS